VVRKLDRRLVDALRARAARHGHSMEAEHRDILRAALGPAAGRATLKAWLLQMPDLGTDDDFRPRRGRGRPVRL
jgi:plasmid stability protein